MHRLWGPGNLGSCKVIRTGWPTAGIGCGRSAPSSETSKPERLMFNVTPDMSPKVSKGEDIRQTNCTGYRSPRLRSEVVMASSIGKVAQSLVGHDLSFGQPELDSSLVLTPAFSMSRQPSRLTASAYPVTCPPLLPEIKDVSPIRTCVSSVTAWTRFGPPPGDWVRPAPSRLRRSSTSYQDEYAAER
jgi:hypothetical protein